MVNAMWSATLRWREDAKLNANCGTNRGTAFSHAILTIYGYMYLHVCGCVVNATSFPMVCVLNVATDLPFME